MPLHLLNLDPETATAVAEAVERHTVAAHIEIALTHNRAALAVA